MDSDFITLLQQSQLSSSPIDPQGLENYLYLPRFLAELSQFEGQMIPLAVRTGPVFWPDPGVLKKYNSIEINGDGVAYVMAWVNTRLVAKGKIIAQDSPKNNRRLNIPRGLGRGYSIDTLIVFQGTFTGHEVFFDLVNE